MESRFKIKANYKYWIELAGKKWQIFGKHKYEFVNYNCAE